MSATLLAPAEVGRLRVRAAARDGPGMRASLDMAIGGADLRPRGLPPATILIVRRLPDAHPGGIHLDAGAAGVDPAWEQSTRDALAAFAARAHRPWNAAVPADASAVRFFDRAEMVACLLADLVEQTAETRWWWRLVLPRIAPSGSPAEAMIAESASLPHVMRLLAARRLATAAVQSLDASEAARVLAAVSSAHGAGELAQVVHAAPTAPEVAGSSVPAAPAAADLAGASVPLAPVRPATSDPGPWHRYLSAGSVPSDLEPEMALLLGVCLMLVVRGAVVRSKAFQAEAAAWLGSQVHRNATATSADRAVSARESATDSDLPAAQVAHRADRAALPIAPGGHPAADPHPRTGSGDAEPKTSHRPGAEVDTDATDAEPGRLEPKTHAALPQDISAEEADTTLAEHEPTGAVAEEGVETGVGGAFYLVNLMNRLDLPGCLDGAWSPAGSVGGWALLDAMARALLPSEHEDDPLWGVLAALDGRPAGSLPAQQAQHGEPYRLPVDWWTPFCGSGSPASWAAARGRLCTWASPGFVLTDGEGAPTRTAATGQLARYGLPSGVRRALAEAPVASLGGTAGRQLSPGISRWLSLAVPYLRHRLGRELGVDPGAAADELLVSPGRLFATRTHVDVVLPLSAASLPVRRSGLDRNPGWVPTLGRVVTYHFE